MNGKEWLMKVRSMTKIEKITWKVFGDFITWDDCRVVIISDLGRDEIHMTRSLDPEINWLNCVSICLVVNRMFELLGIDQRFGAYNEKEVAKNRNVMTNAVNMARQSDPSEDITGIEWEGDL